jgi:hypothetical protein
MDFALPSLSIFSFLLAIVSLKYESEVKCLVSFGTSVRTFSYLVLELLYLKHWFFTALVFDWVLVDVPASFKSEVDSRTGGPEGLWLLDGILRVPDDRASAESCRKYVESRNFFGDYLNPSY